MKKIKSIGREVDQISEVSETTKNLESVHALILLYVKNGAKSNSAILGKVREHFPELGMTSLKNSVTSLEKVNLLRSVKTKDLTDKILITKEGEKNLLEIQEECPEKLLSREELEKLSQETQKVMMATSI